MTNFMRCKDTGNVIMTESPKYWPEYEIMTKKAGKEAYRAQCRDRLLRVIKPGDRVYTVLESVSSTGMSRNISVYIVPGKDDIRNISHLVAWAIDWPEAKRGIKASGCGMDMGFALVYALGAALWPNGTDEPHGRRNGEPDTSGGYALKHEWL